VSARELITEHLDLWTGTITKKSTSGRGSNGKIELTGIKKLRELILELAVRGSLVDQDPNDGSAQELLEQCLKAKTTYVELGKLKKARKHSAITNDDTPFGLPQSWVWSRLDDVVRVINGRAYKKHEMLSSGTPLLRVGNLFTSNDWYYSDLELEDEKYIDSGDLIYAWSASFGPFIWDGGRAIYHYHIWKLDLFDEAVIDKRFLFLYLKAVTEEIKSSGSGIAMIHMTKAKMEELIVPVPPLEEQHRIVQKVDELMALCDRLEQQTSDQLEAHETLVDTLLGTLTQSESATELADNWTRLAAHFDTLFTTEQSIDKLKQTILQLAVMGLLEKPTTTDLEPIKHLLERLSSERDRGDSGGKRKRAKSSSNDAHGLRHPIPKHWAWIKFGETWISSFYGPRFAKQDYVKSGGIPTVRTTDMDRKGKISLVNAPMVLVPEKKRELYLLAKNDILVTRSGSIGVTALYDLDIPAIPSAYLIRLRLCPSINPQYVLIYLSSPLGQKSLGIFSTAVGVPNVSASKMSSFDFPLPPVDEQNRIVQKVDELMTLCDQLKEHLNRASETRTQLAGAVVESALSH